MPHLEGFDSTVEAEFRQCLVELNARERLPSATTAYFGELPCLISALSSRHTVAHVGDYNFQSVYEIACGEPLEL